MGIKKLVLEISSIHDFSSYFPSYSFESLGRDLELSGISIGAREWFSFSISAPIFIGLICSVITIPFTEDIFLPFGMLVFSLVFSLFVLLNYPTYQKRKHAEEMEREYSQAIRDISLKLKLNAPFEGIISSIASGGYGKLSGEYGKAQFEIESGGSVPEAIAHISERIDSALIGRINSQLIFTYENGFRSNALPKLAEEMILMQKMKISEFSSKMSFMGLLFIAISCIVPTLFSAYAIIGSSFLSFSITDSDIYAAYLLIFPAVSVLSLLFIKEKTPKVISM